MITAVMIDNREPPWVQHLQFGGLPVMVSMLESGDCHAYCEDGVTLVIERKTPEDFLHTLADDRLFQQLAKMALMRDETNKVYPYLVITGNLLYGANRKLHTDERATQWDFSSVWGALLTAQELGVYVVFCAGDLDYEACILRLGNRTREPTMRILPPRVPTLYGPAGAILASLPGIGIERVDKILEWSGNKPARAIDALCDLETDLPQIPISVRKRIRHALGLLDSETIAVQVNNLGDEILRLQELS